jgi:hypothetical protein
MIKTIMNNRSHPWKKKSPSWLLKNRQNNRDCLGRTEVSPTALMIVK